MNWVRFTAFEESVRAETDPNDGMSKSANKADNDANLPECRLTSH